MNSEQDPNLMATEAFEATLRRLGLPAAILPHVVAILDERRHLVWRQGKLTPNELQVVLAGLSSRRHGCWIATTTHHPALQAMEPAIAKALAAPLLTRPVARISPADWIADELVTALGRDTVAKAWGDGDSDAITRILAWLLAPDRGERAEGATP